MEMRHAAEWSLRKGVVFLMFISILTGCLLAEEKAVAGQGQDIALEPFSHQFSKDLGNALISRESCRDFSAQEVSLKNLSAVLWAANGVNREKGKRTAPAPYGKYVIDLYVVMEKGVYLYLPDEHSLQFVSERAIKDKVGKQGDIKKASHVLVMVAKTHRLPFIVKKENRLPMAHATAGCIAQNVYLAASALDLGTRLVEGLNEKIIKETFALQKEEEPLYIMPLGYPKR